MNIQYDKEIMVFRKDFEGKQLYSLGVSKKKPDGTYEKGYITCQFKKGEILENMTKIIMNKAWVSFYTKDKKTTPYIFINDYTIAGVPTKEEKQPTSQKLEDIEIAAEDFPF